MPYFIPLRFLCCTHPQDSWSSITHIHTDWALLHFWKQNDRWLIKNQTRSMDFFTAHSTYFYFPIRLWAENPHWTSFVPLYCYYHSLISKRICVVDPLSGAFNVSWLTWIYQRRNVIVVMMFAAKQSSLAWVKSNTWLGRKNIAEHWFPSWVHRFSFWNLTPQDAELSLRPHKTIKLHHAVLHFSGAGQKHQLYQDRTPTVHWKVRVHILLQQFKVHRSYQVSLVFPQGSS